MFNRYTFHAKPCGPSLKHVVNDDILLDGTAIANWSHYYNDYMDRSRFYLQVFEGAERTISTAFGLTDEDDKKYAATNGTEMDDNKRNLVPRPRLEIASVCLESTAIGDGPKTKAILEPC